MEAPCFQLICRLFLFFSLGFYCKDHTHVLPALLNTFSCLSIIKSQITCPGSTCTWSFNILYALLCLMALHSVTTTIELIINWSLIPCPCSVDFLVSAAVAEFKGPEIFGVVRFAQVNMELAQIEASFGGLSTGKHGWSINEFGDLTRGAASTGKVFTPTNQVTDEEVCSDLCLLSKNSMFLPFYLKLFIDTNKPVFSFF